MNTDLVIQRASGITSESTIDEIREVLGFVNFLSQIAREAKRLFESALEQRIRDTGEDITVGDIRYYLGVEKKTICKSASATIYAILRATGGDEDRLVQCLSANWVKHGAVKRTLEEFGQADRFGELFDIQVTSELKEGKPQKKLLNYNTKFVPSKGV